VPACANIHCLYGHAQALLLPSVAFLTCTSSCAFLYTLHRMELPAGHTPYSLPGSTGSRMQELPEECDSDEDSSSEATHIPLITATGVQRVAAPARHSAVRMELFASGGLDITQEEAEVTPLPAAAARYPRSPADLSPADGDSSDVTGPLSAAAAAGGTAAEGAANEGSECDESDMEMQTPAPLPFLSRLQYAAGVSARSAHPTPAATAARAARSAAGEPAGALGHSKAPFSAAGADSSRAVDAESPSGGSSFTGFAGGAPSEQQAGSMTPTLFDSGDSSSRGACGNRGGSSSSLQHLMGADDTPAASHAAAAAAAAAHQTPQQHTSHMASSAACSQVTAVSAAAAADGPVSSPPRSLQLPAPTPKSKLRQPERVAVEGRM
jgi:hypothetical protein